MCGFNVNKLKDFKANNSSSSYFINLSGRFFSKACFDFSKAFNSINDSLSFVV